MALEQITEEFPYLQSARALYLKGLFNEDSFKYNQALRKTAAYTTERSVLFDFITSGNFQTLQKTFLEEKEARINDIIVNGSEVIHREVETPTESVIVDKLEQSILTSIKEASPEIEEELQEPKEMIADTVEAKLEIGKPIPFSKDEKHSFQEWLQLARFKPIDRENVVEKEKLGPADPDKIKKSQIIDKFIEANPKIPPIKQTEVRTPVQIQSSSDNSYLMTETLAKVYLEQKKYQKAIQAYEILILKYPEKSSLFADRISDIRILQQNNN